MHPLVSVRGADSNVTRSVSGDPKCEPARDTVRAKGLGSTYLLQYPVNSSARMFSGPTPAFVSKVAMAATIADGPAR